MRLKSFYSMSWVMLGCIALMFSSCTPKQIASDITAQIMASGAPSFEMESDIEIAETAGLTMIKMMEAFQYDNPKNKTLNTLLARSYANYAQGFWEYEMLTMKGVDDSRYEKALERAKRFYQAGKDYGLKALSTNGAFKSALKKDLDTYKKALKSFGRSDVPKLFWTAMNWGSLINLSKDSPIAIAEFPKVEAMMERVLHLDENFFYAGPHLFFGFSFGSRPKMFGGDSEKSKQHFEAAAKAYNRKFLLGLTFYAQVYAVQIQDPMLFDQLLNEVLAANPADLPQARLANELAQKRAKWLLANRAKFFDVAP